LTDSENFKKINISSIQPTSISAGWGHSSVGSHLGLMIFGRPYDFSPLLRINRIHKIFPFFGRTVSNITTWFGETGGLYKLPSFISELEIADVSSSAGLTLFLTTSGEVYTFGVNRWGQCGSDNFKIPHMYSPSRINVPPMKMIDTGLQHCIGITKNGQVYTWGKGERGQLGNGQYDNLFEPCLVKLPLEAKYISAGFSHSTAILSDGSVYIWGKGFSLTPKSTTTGNTQIKINMLNK
jgi:alpha-tubulin suppressor-like RCC1 family protein